MVGGGARGCAVTWSMWDTGAKVPRSRHWWEVWCRLGVWAHELAVYSQTVTKLTEYALESQGPVALLPLPEVWVPPFFSLLHPRECFSFLPRVDFRTKVVLVLGEPADPRG